MATTPGYGSAYKSVPQNLYTITTDQLGKDIPTSVGTSAYVTFDTPTSSAGSDITDNNDGTYSLAGNLDYLVTSTVTLNNVTWATAIQPPLLLLVNTADGSNIGAPVPVGETLTSVVPASLTPVTVAVQAIAPDFDTAGVWAYPAQIANGTLTIQVIGGF
jgi:hypothetical protein